MVLDINLENNIEASFSLRQLLNTYIPNTIVPENEDMKTYRTWEYYDGIIRYCMFMHQRSLIDDNVDGVPSKTILFIQNKMPDLYEYFKTQYPELIRID